MSSIVGGARKTLAGVGKRWSVRWDLAERLPIGGLWWTDYVRSSFFIKERDGCSNNIIAHSRIGINSYSINSNLCRLCYN